MISSPVPWRPACASPCCSWRQCGCARSSAYCRRRTPPPPGRSPWQPAAFAWQPTAFDSWSGLPLPVEDVDLHTTKRRRRRSPSVQPSPSDARGAAGAPARTVASPVAQASGGSSLAGSQRFPAQPTNLDRATPMRADDEASAAPSRGRRRTPVSNRSAAEPRQVRGERQRRSRGRRPPMIGRT
jgi:hypothetical protein